MNSAQTLINLQVVDNTVVTVKHDGMDTTGTISASVAMQSDKFESHPTGSLTLNTQVTYISLQVEDTEVASVQPYPDGPKYK